MELSVLCYAATVSQINYNSQAYTKADDATAYENIFLHSVCNEIGFCQEETDFYAFALNII